jgi:hypothetical protein
MRDDFDVGRLAEIPDPFVGHPAGRTVTHAVPMPAGSPTRARVRALRGLAAALALAFEIAWLERAGLRPDLRTTPAQVIALGFLPPAVAAALALGAVTRRGFLGLGEPAARVVALVFGPPIFFAAVTLFFAPRAEEGGSFWGGVLGCMSATALLAGVPLALGALAFRRAFPSASRWRTAALGVACGAIAAATICFACSDGSALHVLVGHGAAMLAAGLVGAFLIARLTRA